MSSFKPVAGARYEVERKTAAANRAEIDHLLEVVFEPHEASLVPG